MNMKSIVPLAASIVLVAAGCLEGSGTIRNGAGADSGVIAPIDDAGATTPTDEGTRAQGDVRPPPGDVGMDAATVADASPVDATTPDATSDAAADAAADAAVDAATPDMAPDASADAGADAGPLCGNGVIETGEICDGDCPTACVAPNACTISTLTGSATTCDAMCMDTSIVACINGDGCCPTACTSLTDDDCMPMCGNGIVETGEECDGNCPSSCTPPNSCTVSALVGDAATCDAVCMDTTITACTDGDGCCPPACTTANDDDCNAVCGNSLVEAGELCDGNCPTTCMAPDACTNSTLTGDAATCDARCVDTAITACTDADGCCPATCTSVDDDDCMPMCGNGVVESGEQCDGNCPSSCAAPNACTVSTLVGDAMTCDAMCMDSAITSCTNGDGCCPAACTDANDDDCPPSTACTPGDWATLLSTHPISSSTHSGPVFAAPLSSGGALVAFHDAGAIHIVEVNADGSRTGVEHTTSGTRLYGLAAHDGGRAVLVSRGTDILALVAFSPAGATQIDQTILGDVPHDVTNNEWFGSLLRQGRLTWTGSSWATYNTVQRLWSDGIAHYGDTLRYYDANGARLGGGWGWGCSHSMEVRISHNGTRTGPVCLSDCYPSKGVHFNHNDEKLYSDPASNCAGGYSTELGASVPASDGFWVLFGANDMRSSQDVAIAKIDNSANNTSGLIWYTADAVADSEPNAAQYGTSELLVAWKSGANDTFLRADFSTGAAIGSSATRAGDVVDTASDFFTFPNGDVGWAYSDGTGVSLAVVEACP